MTNVLLLQAVDVTPIKETAAAAQSRPLDAAGRPSPRAAEEAGGPMSWRWLLVDATTGTTLTDHPVTIDPGVGGYATFTDLYEHLRRNADPHQRLASEQQLLTTAGNWAGEQLLGERIGRIIVEAAPVTVRMMLPDALGFLPQWPWEIVHVGGRPLARQNVTIVYDIAPPTISPRPWVFQPRPAEDVLRVLAVFSLPARSTALGLRRERRALTDLIRRIAARHRVELTVLQYGVTREKLDATVESGDGWDVVHVSAHSDAGRLVLEKADGSPDPINTDLLVTLLQPARPRVKLVVLSACQSAAATTAETLRLLDLDPGADTHRAEADTYEADTYGEDRPAAGSGGRSRAGLARALAGTLGCAVLAMRYPVGDEFAIRLAAALYERLFARGLPLDAALRGALPDAAGPESPAELTDAVPPVSLATPALFGGDAAHQKIISAEGRQPLRLDTATADFDPEPARFVGRAAPMARASAALAPASGRTAVLFHGMAGGGKTACALELAYRHAGTCAAALYWTAPTDPDAHDLAFARFADAWELQLVPAGAPSLTRITTVDQLRGIAPVLTALCRQNALLIVLDNLETLLTPDGHAWRDDRWPVLLRALTIHDGPSRLVLTSRTPLPGLDPARTCTEPVHALTLDEAAVLARELDDLGALLHADTAPERDRTGHARQPSAEAIRADRGLVRRVLGVVQGHPKLLELADAAARQGREVLEEQLVAAEQAAAGRGPALSAFFSTGRSGLDADGFVDTLTGWVTAAVAGLAEPAGLLLQLLCALEDDDRTQPVVEANWADVWHRLGRPGEAPPADGLRAVLTDAALVAVDTPPPPAAADTDTDADADADGPGADADGPSLEVTVLRVHPGVAEAVHAGTPQEVRTAVDVALAAFWRAVFEAARGRAEGEASQMVARAGLSAAPYLLRLHDWDQAGFLLEQAFVRDLANPGMVQAVLPLLRRIADTTGTPDKLGVFGRALAKVDPAGGEQVLRQALAWAEATCDPRTAAASGGTLIDLLAGQGRLAEALTVADTTAAHRRQAGTGRWTQALDEARRLQILYRMGQGEQVLAALDGPDGLLARLDRLPDHPDPTDTVRPWNIREVTLEIGAVAAVALGRWQQALDYNARVQASKRRRGAGPHELARTRFNDYGPLIALGRLDQADTLLADCQQTFADTGDITVLGKVFTARADLADTRGQHPDAARLAQIALRLIYTHPDPDAIAVSHHNLANYLGRTGADRAAVHAHRLAATTLYRLIGDTDRAASSLRALAEEVTTDPDSPPPATVAGLAAIVDQTDGVHFAALIDGLCPDRATADQTIRDIINTATISGTSQAVTG
ncbi:CHAT domain-containing protein [Frankia sp. Cr2]|uniref:CHAT domain-containing protein n=1 Tax=Frankia sp. Cr2 TaxID=3073932 RepID=UPI002AD415AB|nr:CHAT domain-containing protein [Frankia sp. Cr2]